MIYFITNESDTLKKYKTKLYNNITALEDSLVTYKLFKKWVVESYKDKVKIIAIDLETTGLDAYKDKIVLSTISTEEDSFVFHSAHCNEEPYYKYIKEKDFTILGQNIKFDIKYIKTKHNIFFTKLWDTMIAEQRLYMKSGMRNGLDSLAQRYLDIYPDAMDKRIRKEFINCNPVKFNVLPKHIYYVAGDGETLFPVKRKQEVKIKEYGMEFLIYDIEFPLISIIAKAELTGFDFNIDKWIEIYKDNLQHKFETEKKLDIEFINLRETIQPKDILYIKGGKWDNERVHNSQYDVFNDDGTTNVLDLFGEPMSKQLLTKTKKKVDKYPNNINYSSDSQIAEIFGRLGQPVLDKAESLVIPKFQKTGKLDRTGNGYQTGKDAMHTYLTMLPNTVMKSFINLLLDHRGYSTACNNFGINYKNKLNPVTGKLHTSFRQASADTGRFQSGGGTKEPDKPNFQNIPSKAHYAIAMRNCFLAKPGHKIDTADLSGAELIIMCSLSQDLKLLEIASDDMHSYIAQKCWRKIYKLRAMKLITYHDGLRVANGLQYTDKKIVDNINKYITLSNTFIVSKKTNKNIRTNFKPMGFGTIYGMYPKKATKTLNLNSVDEGAIVISTIQNEFPDVFKMVIAASATAKANGFLILNTRTNSRAWFPNLIELKRGNISEKTHFGLISKEESEARNIRIQGTQADMIKEATVRIQKWIDDTGFSSFECVYDEVSENWVPIVNNDITMLSWIHDEIVTDFPAKLAEDRFKLRYLSIQGNVIEKTNFPALKKAIMSDTCNAYLNNVTMDVEYDVCDYWTK